MDISTKQMWQTNIDECADRVAEIYGRDNVNFIFARYGATSFDVLGESFYGMVFSDLEQLLND